LLGFLEVAAGDWFTMHSSVDKVARINSSNKDLQNRILLNIPYICVCAISDKQKVDSIAAFNTTKTTA